RRVVRIGDGKPDLTLGGAIRKGQHVAQKAARELAEQRGGSQQLWEMDARKLVEASDLVGEFGGWKVALLPEPSQAGGAVLAFGPGRMGSDYVIMVSGTQIAGKAFGFCSIGTHDTPSSKP